MKVVTNPTPREFSDLVALHLCSEDDPHHLYRWSCPEVPLVESEWVLSGMTPIPFESVVGYLRDAGVDVRWQT